MLDDSDWSHKAWMSKPDADLFEQILIRQAQAAPRLEVLEWGAGRSTLYFTQLLRDLGHNFNWVAVEYDRAFFQRDIEPKLGGVPDVGLEYIGDGQRAAPARMPRPKQGVQFAVYDHGKLSPFMPDHEADRLPVMDAYIDFPRDFGQQFDLILVDGRKRRRCLLAAADCLKENGLALLHDAYRPYYHCAFERFTSHRPIGEILWIGSNQATDFDFWLNPAPVADPPHQP